jgi:hypothetical protein
LPLQDPSTAIEVLDRAVGELDLRSVSLIAHNESRPLASDTNLPVFRADCGARRSAVPAPAFPRAHERIHAHHPH